MKLYIDDIRKAPDETWNLCKTAVSAIRAIAFFGDEITDISLDHDISHQVTIGTGLERPFPCEETYQSVAYFIGAYYKGKPGPNVHIHTSNKQGAEAMDHALGRFEFQGKVTITLSPAANRLEMELK